MKTSQVVFLAVVGCGASLGAGGWAGMHWDLIVPKRAIGATVEKDESSMAATQLYTCSMHPQVIWDHPGNCPICGMVLTPMHMTTHARATSGDADVVIDPVVVQNMGVRVAR